MMQKLSSIYLLLFLFLNMLGAQSVKENGCLQINGTQLQNEQGQDIVLRGMSLGWHNWWPQYFTSETVSWLKNDWKNSVIRVPMGIDPDSGYLKQPDWSLETINTVIEAAIENDMYVIIDWHSHKIYTQEAIKFFSMMAQKYGNYPHIIYEIYNEPIKDSWKEVKEYSIAVISEIRKYDPDNIILVGNPHWCQDIHLVADSPIEGFENIMYTIHFYAGTHKVWLRERCDYAIQKGIPIFISEYGECNSDGDGPIDYQEWNSWLEWMDMNKISWCKWMIADKNETSAALLPGTPSSNWQKEQLSESGGKTRQILRNYSGFTE